MSRRALPPFGKPSQLCTDSSMSCLPLTCGASNKACAGKQAARGAPPWLLPSQCVMHWTPRLLLVRRREMVPRRRARTLLHVLGEAIEASSDALARLDEVDLRRSVRPVREQLQQARASARTLHAALLAAHKAETERFGVEARAHLAALRRRGSTRAMSD